MLEFSIVSAAPVAYSAAPALEFALRIASPTPVQGIALHTQIRIEPTRRNYDPAAQEKLFDLFGTPGEWGRTVHSLLWTHVDMMVAGFTAEKGIELLVPCSFDFNVAGTKYFAGIQDGEIPLVFLFSGTVFGQDAAGRMQVSRISWEAEADYRLPVKVWQEMMQKYYPEGAWVCVRRGLMERLMRFKRDRGLSSVEQALEMLVPEDEGAVR